MGEKKSLKEIIVINIIQSGTAIPDMSSTFHLEIKFGQLIYNLFSKLQNTLTMKEYSIDT